MVVDMLANIIMTVSMLVLVGLFFYIGLNEQPIVDEIGREELDRIQREMTRIERMLRRRYICRIHSSGDHYGCVEVIYIEFEDDQDARIQLENRLGYLSEADRKWLEDEELYTFGKERMEHVFSGSGDKDRIEMKRVF